MRNMVYRLILFLFAVGLFVNIYAADYLCKGNEVVYKGKNEMLRIRVCSESIIRFTKNSSEVFPKENDLVVIKKGWSSVRYNLKEVKGGLELQTDSLKVLLVYSPLRLVVMNKQGVVLYEEKDYTLNANADTCTAPRNVCTLFPEDHFFGFGERMDFLDQRGKRLYLNCELGKGPKPAVGGKDILRANYCPVPFYMSTRGYAIFLNTAYPTEWDIDRKSVV